MDYQHILFEVTDNIAVITMNRPESLNAISLDMKNELDDALGEVENNDDILVAILAGAGRAFSAGHDNNDSLSCMPKFVRMQEERRLYNLSKPIIAAVQGYALGDGLQQAILCDIIIAADDAIMAFIGPEVGGLCYGSFTVLPAIIGRQRANELLFTCKRVSAEEGYRIGLVNQVVPNDQLMDAAMTMARAIAKLPPKSIHYTKQALRKTFADESHMAAVEKGWEDILSGLDTAAH